MISMLLIGWFYYRRTKTRQDYILGGGNMNPISIGISLFATLLSALSYLSSPGELIRHGPIIFSGMIAFPFIFLVAGWWLIPRIMTMKVTSAYEILESKLGLNVRMLATCMFLALRLLWMGTIIFATVKIALLPVISINPGFAPLMGFLLIAVTVVYTSMGGIKAVVVTDVLQSAIFLGGALFCIVTVSVDLGSFTRIFPVEWPSHWETLKIGFDAKERNTIANAALSVFIWYICTTGSDQMVIQRYLATSDVKAARRSLKISLSSDFLANCLLALVGLSMLAYFTKYEHLLGADASIKDQADTLFPRFILIGLPPGVSGLVMAGILAAAMSSLSSGLNSVSSVISEDFLLRFGGKKKTGSLKQIRLLSFVIGGVVMVLSFLIGHVEGNLFDVLMKVVNLFVAPLFVLFFMALFVPGATSWGAFVGGGAAVIAAVAVAFFSVLGISVLFIMPAALIAGISTGLATSFLERWIRARDLEL